MTDHVAVLRMVGKEFRQKCRNRGADCEICARTEAAIAHAIAAVAERDALVARLGELEKAWRKEASGHSHYETDCGVALAHCADDLARAVGGDE